MAWFLVNPMKLAADAEKVVGETRRCSNKTNCNRPCRAFGLSSRVPTNMWIIPHHLNSPRIPPKPRGWTKYFYNLAEVCRILAVLLWPFLPETASKIYAQLGLAGAP